MKKMIKLTKEEVNEAVNDFFKENWKYIVFSVITIVMVIGITIGCVEILSRIVSEYDIEKWNNGICSECGDRYELFAVSYGKHTYICPNCKHEIDCLGAMR